MPLASYQHPVRLACLIHAASVRSEPESNSPSRSFFFLLSLSIDFAGPVPAFAAVPRRSFRNPASRQAPLRDSRLSGSPPSSARRASRSFSSLFPSPPGFPMPRFCLLALPARLRALRSRNPQKAPLVCLLAFPLLPAAHPPSLPVALPLPSVRRCFAGPRFRGCRSVYSPFPVRQPFFSLFFTFFSPLPLPPLLTPSHPSLYILPPSRKKKPRSLPERGPQSLLPLSFPPLFPRLRSRTGTPPSRSRSPRAPGCPRSHRSGVRRMSLFSLGRG